MPEMEAVMNDVKETVKSAGEKARGRGRGGGLGNVARKALVPLSAALASAAVGYAARKVPRLLGERVLPKLREQGDARDLARDMTNRARDLVESHTPLGSGRSDGGRGRTDGASLSGRSYEEREQERAARAARRRGRRAQARR
jgi:hypothetical protein